MEGVTVLNHGPYSDQPTGQLSHARIPTLEGDMYATPGDWIITGVQGEVYPCKPEIFEQTYEPIDVDIFKAVNDEGFEQPEYVH